VHRDGSAVELVGLCASVVRWLADLSDRGQFPQSGVKRPGKGLYGGCFVFKQLQKKKLWTSDTHMQLGDRGAGNLPSNPGLSAAVTHVESLVQEGLRTLYYLR